MTRWQNFKSFHKQYVEYGDCDPSYPMLNHLADELKMDMEDKYFMAWIYSCCYNDATTYYIMKNLPKYKDIKVEEIEKWWIEHKPKMVFTTDRLKVKSFDKLPEMFKSYRKLVGINQEKKLLSLLDKNPIISYNNLYKFSSNFYYFGRFSLFLYLEILNVLTKIPIEIDTIHLQDAESSRNGLCYVISKDEWVTKKHEKCKLGVEEYKILYESLHKLVAELKSGLSNTTYWNVETSLCAYKKLFWEARYLGYYIDRSLVGLKQMQKLNPELEWQFFWDFRKKFFNPFFLGEVGGWDGVRKDRFKIFNKYNNNFIYPDEYAKL